MGSKKDAKPQAKSGPGAKVPFAKNMHELDEGDDVDFENLVREEYMRLHRQYRLMEDAHHLLLKGRVSKKEEMMEMLTDEKLEIETNLYNAEAEQWVAADKQNAKTIMKMLETFDSQSTQIENTLKAVAEMEENVDKITKRLIEQKLRVQAVYGRSMTFAEADKRLRILENRLYHETTKLDTKVSENKELREDIHVILRLRGIFYDRLVEIKKQTNAIKQRMGEVVFLATSAYELRDDWAAKIKILRERNDKDSKQHVLELKELNRILHNDTKLHGFLMCKIQERSLMESIYQRHERKNAIQIKEINERLALYEKSFNDITKYSRQRSIPSLLNTYMYTEQQNFGVFKFITDLNYEINGIHDETLLVAKEINQIHLENKARFHDWNEEIREREDVIKGKQEKLSSTQKIREYNHNLLLGYIKGLEVLYQTLECDYTPLGQLLGGGKTTITPENIQFCLRIIERRVEYLLSKKVEYEIRQAYESGKPLKFGPLSTQGTGQKNKTHHSGGPFLPKIIVTGNLSGETDDEESDRTLAERPHYFKEVYDDIKDKMKNNTMPETVNLSVSRMIQEESHGSVHAKEDESKT